MAKATSNKLKKLSSLVKITEKLKMAGKKIVLCHGVFDLIHPGHIRYFQSAKAYGDILIVAIIADNYVNAGPGRPVFKQDLRVEVLASIELIDYIFILNSDTAVDLIKKIKPNYYIKGPDNKAVKNVKGISDHIEDEKKAIESVGGNLIYSEDTIIFSSSKIIGDYLDVYPENTKRYLNNIKSKYSAESIISNLSNLSKIKILIIGDAIIDQYYYVSPMGKSSKEPVMVHQYVSHESFIGGVLATANHVASLSHKITMVTLLGKKMSYKSFILKKLNPFVKPIFYYQSKESTIIKRRFVDVHSKQKLFQVSYLKDDFLMPQKIENEIWEFLNNEISKFDMVIVNDFGHGMLTHKIIRLICRKAKYIALNVQANSANFGFNIITKYPRADYICIDNQEIRLATHDKFSDLLPLVKKVYRKMKSNYMIVTRGPMGLNGYSSKLGIVEAPALSDRIVDRVGAGDALFAITAPCVYAGLPFDIINFVGNVAGALKIQIIGNRKQIEFNDLSKFITRLLK